VKQISQFATHGSQELTEGSSTEVFLKYPTSHLTQEFAASQDKQFFMHE
jgi:hypothetical protein